jgi:hypothetical protein
VAQFSYADGVVSRCDNPSFSAALFGGGSVTFTCTGTIMALNNPITIGADTTIIGNYHVTIDGGDVAQLFALKPGVKLTLENLTLTAASDRGVPYPGGAFVRNDGTLVVKNCIFTNGRAVYNAILNNSGAVLDVRQSTFLGIPAEVIGNLGSATVTNSTFWQNLNGAIYTSGKLSITNSTLFDSGGVNIFVGLGGSAVVQNTIIESTPGIPNCSGIVTDGGGNLRWPGPPEDTSCSGVGSVAYPQLLRF